MPKPTLYIIDGYAQFFRAYHAIRSQLTSPVTKEPTNMTFGFLGMLLKLLRGQGKLGGNDFAVVAINIDTRDPDKPRNFLKEAGLTRLDYFTDQKAKVFQDLKSVGKALGMPTSLLVDGQGCEIANLAGPAEWASGDAIKLIKAAVRPATAGL